MYRSQTVASFDGLEDVPVQDAGPVMRWWTNMPKIKGLQRVDREPSKLERMEPDAILSDSGDESHQSVKALRRLGLEVQPDHDIPFVLVLRSSPRPESNHHIIAGVSDFREQLSPLRSRRPRLRLPIVSRACFGFSPRVLLFLSLCLGGSGFRLWC